ncbi:MAG: LysR family transcriptional regulator [Pseudomonadota bacterium]
MNNKSAKRDLSLKALELFQISARSPSLQHVSEETGLSVSTISHHLRSLEEHLGVELFNHTRRPMVLTPKGQAFLRNIDEALYAIRKAKAEASAGNIAEASYLRLGAIEDFDSDITPELAVFLAAKMPRCQFLHHTDTSQTIIDMLRNRQLDLGVTGTPTERLRDLQDYPLLRDPFVVVLPRAGEHALPDLLAGQATPPFLRFSRNLMIARQIESQLRRMGLSLPHRFECGNHQTLMAMVAAGAGWTITTPLLFARAKRFQPRLKMVPFPGKSFARTLSIVATPDCSRSILDLVDRKMRALITAHAIKPFQQSAPWLEESFALVS